MIGADEPQTAEILYTLYRPILDQTFQPPPYLPRPEELGAVPLISTDLASAELIKYAANAFLALKISYINEIGLLSEKVGADIAQVAKGIGLDARIGTRFLQAGIGWGGSCFGKDTAALIATAAEYGLEMPIVKPRARCEPAATRSRGRQAARRIEDSERPNHWAFGARVQAQYRRFARSSGDGYRAQADRARRPRQSARSGGDGRFRSEYPDLAVVCCESPKKWPRDADAGCW